MENNGLSPQAPVTEFAPEEVQLAPGVGENVQQETLTPSQRYERAFDPAGFAAEQNGQVVPSLLNAATPTPTGEPVNPSIATTLSNLGKVEPQQLADASRALTPLQQPQAPQVTSILDQLPQDNVQQSPTGPQAPQIADPYTKAFEQQQAANNAIASAVTAKAQADQTAFQNAEKAYVEAEQKREEAKIKFDSDYNERINQFNQSIADMKQAAGDKVIPGKVLADMSTGQKIQAGLFMALSAYGSAMSGQESQALKVINNAINADIDAQKFNIENKLRGARAGVEANQYLVSQMRQKFQDDESAILASRAAMLAMTQQQLNTNASKLDERTAGPKAKALNAQLEVQKQGVLQQLKQAQAQQFMINNITGDKIKNLSDAELRAMESIDKGYRDRYVRGYGPAANSEQAKKFTEYAAEIGPALDSLDRIKGLTKNFNKVTDLTKRAQIQAEISALVGNLRIPITGPGILTPAERKMIENDVIGNPNSLLNLNFLQRAKLDTIYNKLSSDMAKRGSLAGLPDSSFKRSSKSTTFKD